MRTPEQLLKRFYNYHLQRPHVFHAFRDTVMSIARDYEGWLPAKKIMRLAARRNKFPVVSDYTSIYVRLLIIAHPELSSRFILRNSKIKHLLKG